MHLIVTTFLSLYLVLSPAAGAFAAAIGYSPDLQSIEQTFHAPGVELGVELGVTATAKAECPDCFNNPFLCDGCHLAASAVVATPMVLPEPLRPDYGLDRPRTARAAISPPIYRPPTV